MIADSTPFGILVYGDEIYWTDSASDSINVLRKRNVSDTGEISETNRTELIGGFQNIGHLTLVRKSDLVHKGQHNYCGFPRPC